MEIRKMCQWNRLILMLPAILWAASLFAQKEPESIDKYRVAYEFKAPVVEASGDPSGTQTQHRVGSDSMGVYYYYDRDLAKLIELHRATNEKSVEGQGFRIQIYAGSRMETANEAKADFVQAFHNSNMEVYKDWNPPHFWVRVGDFLTRNEAMKQLPNVRQFFPDAFVVQDKIKLPKYKKSTHHD